MLLNFSDRTRTGAFNMVWSYTLDTLRSVALNKNALKLEPVLHSTFLTQGGVEVILEHFRD